MTTRNSVLEFFDVVDIHNGTLCAVLNDNLNKGSLIIGSIGFCYGTSWNSGNEAGLLMECSDNSEIAVHDNAKRLASLIYYEA